MSKAMKKARILSSESKAGVMIKQVQDTDIDLSIIPPAQQVNFQPCAMAELATMAPPASLHKSTFNPILEDIREAQSPSEVYINSSLMHRGLVQHQPSASIQTDGPSAQESPRVIARPSHSQEDPAEQSDIKEEPKETTNRAVPNGVTMPIDRGLTPIDLPKLRQAPPPRLIDIMSAQRTLSNAIESRTDASDVSLIDELKRPEEMLPDYPSIKKLQEQEQEQLRLQGILDAKIKRAKILEAMLEIYENKHWIVDGLLTCKQPQLARLIRAYCGAEAVEITLEPPACGCTLRASSLMDIKSIFITTGGKTVDFRYGFNETYIEMVRHSINLTQVIA
jgi:hypothetical protein